MLKTVSKFVIKDANKLDNRAANIKIRGANMFCLLILFVMSIKRLTVYC